MQLLRRDRHTTEDTWKFAGIGHRKAQNLFSLDSYMQKYGDDQKRRECEDWKLTIFGGDFNIRGGRSLLTLYPVCSKTEIGQN